MATPESKDGAGPPSDDAAPASSIEQPEAQRGEPEAEAALPSEEMGFSNSTLHWLSDGDQSRPTTGHFPITLPSFDPTAPVAGRRRAVLVVGGAAAVALLVAGGRHLHSYRHRAAPVTATVDPAGNLTARAERALAENRVAEALDMAKRAGGRSALRGRVLPGGHLRAGARLHRGATPLTASTWSRASRHSRRSGASGAGFFGAVSDTGRARTKNEGTLPSLATLRARYVERAVRCRSSGRRAGRRPATRRPRDPRGDRPASTRQSFRGTAAPHHAPLRERPLAAGVVHVAGVDEAGMSPLAGPVAAAAVIFAPEPASPTWTIASVSAPSAGAPGARHQGQAIAWAVGFAEVEEIDRINIYWAGLLAMRRASKRCAPPPSTCLIDGRR